MENRYHFHMSTYKMWERTLKILLGEIEVIKKPIQPKKKAEADAPVILTGVKPKPKKSYSAYEYLFKASRDYGSWRGEKRR